MSEQTTLRDTLEDAFASAETATELPENATETASTVPEAEVKTEPETPAGRTANRLRDEKGRLLPGTKPQEAAPVEKPVEAPAPVVERKPPSSWKKDYWEAYQKLDPQLADYISQREQQFASGVSTYKQEAERAREIFQAIAPFQQDLQQHGVNPTQWIANLGNAHQRLVKGSDVEKLQMLSKLTSDYRIPAKLAVQGPDGQWQLLDERQLPAAQPTYQQPMVPDVKKLVAEELEAQRTAQEIESMRSDAEKYPHFEQVRDTMAGLLQSGLADNLISAYEAAIRLPLHAELWEAQQQQQRQQEEARIAAEKKAVVSKARANVVSPKSATPTGAMTTNGKQGLRDILAETVEAKWGGRV